MQEIMRSAELLGKIEECDREHIGNIKHNSFVGNRNKATKH